MKTIILEQLIEEVNYKDSKPIYKNEKVFGFTIPSNFYSLVDAVKAIKKLNKWNDSGIYTKMGLKQVLDNGDFKVGDSNNNPKLDLIELAWEWNEFKNVEDATKAFGELDDDNGIVLDFNGGIVYVPFDDCYSGGGFNRGNEVNMMKVSKILNKK